MSEDGESLLENNEKWEDKEEVSDIDASDKEDIVEGGEEDDCYNDGGEVKFLERFHEYLLRDCMVGMGEEVDNNEENGEEDAVVLPAEKRQRR